MLANNKKDLISEISLMSSIHIGIAFDVIVIH